MGALMVLNPYTSSNNGLNGWEIRYSYLNGNSVVNTTYAQSNPEFTPPDLVSFFPEFTGLVDVEGAPYYKVAQKFIEMANSRLDEGVLGADWEFCMAALVAHYMAAMFMRMGGNDCTTIQNVQQRVQMIGSAAIGVATKEDLGGESIEVSLLESDKGLSGAGEYLATPYGRLFWTTFKPYRALYLRGVVRGWM